MASLSKGEFAKHVGLSPGRISQLIRRGLPVGPDKRIDLAAGVGWISLRVDPTHKDALRCHACLNPSVPALTSPQPPPPQSPVGSADPSEVLLRAKARLALLDVKRSERQEKQVLGELVEIEKVAGVVERLVFATKCRLLALPGRLGPRLAVERDPDRCAKLIDHGILEALQELLEFRVTDVV